MARSGSLLEGTEFIHQRRVDMGLYCQCNSLRAISGEVYLVFAAQQSLHNGAVHGFIIHNQDNRQSFQVFLAFRDYSYPMKASFTFILAR